MQSLEEIEKWYENSDPWGYETNPDDKRRKEKILGVLENYERALDIGCGEGWITKDLPAKEIYGVDVSEKALQRLPSNVNKGLGEGKYDLVCLMGILYPHYGGEKILSDALNLTERHLLITGMKDWLIDLSFLGKPLKEEEFEYRGMIQVIKLYGVTA